MPEIPDFIKTAIDAGAALGEPRTPVTETDAAGAAPGIYTVIPRDYRIESLQPFMPRPLRIGQMVTFHDSVSFCSYIREFGTQAITHLFFDAESESFRAVLDYHSAGRVNDTATAPTAGWCGHVARFQTKRSPEFTVWMEKNRKSMAQIDFARFLEDNLPDVVEPEGATLLAIALTFEAKKDVEYASGVRLQNGQIQFKYSEVIRGSAQTGTLEVPEQFVLGIPVHVGGPAYRIPVRFRWRLQEGKAAFWYEMVRPHRFIEDALAEMRTRITADTGFDVLAGKLEYGAGAGA